MNCISKKKLRVASSQCSAQRKSLFILASNYSDCWTLHSFRGFFPNRSQVYELLDIRAHTNANSKLQHKNSLPTFGGIVHKFLYCCVLWANLKNPKCRPTPARVFFELTSNLKATKVHGQCMTPWPWGCVCVTHARAGPSDLGSILGMSVFYFQ